MDNCMVCLESNGDVYSRLSINSDEWNKYNVQHIIEKHLWWWTKNHFSWICHECWSSLWSFHTFYLRVQKSQNMQFLTLISGEPTKAEEADDDENVTENPEELYEDLIPLAKRKRGRPKLFEENLNITVADVDIKSETGSLISDHHEQNSTIMSDEEGPECDEFQDDCSSSKLSSASEEIVNVPIEKSRKTASCKKNKPKDDGASSIHLTKKYDSFIAENHELFCSLCHIPLSDFQNLILHFQKDHSSTKPFAMCCDKKFYKRAIFVDHLYVHKDPEYFKCKHCEKVLSNRRCLKNHLESHDESRKAKYNCEECGKNFFRSGSLAKHKLLHVPEEERKFQCIECDKKFASESLRTQHMKVTHLNKYAKICDVCGKAFRERYSFQRHLSEHTGIPTPNIECDLCGMKLTSIYGLNRHRRLRHTEENMQEQICPYCSKVSPNIAAHKSHIQYSHTMKRRHACHLCEKAFRRPKELKEHLSTHTGEALYTCPHCPRTFISNANMHKHRKNEHRKEWEENRSQNRLLLKVSEGISKVL
ncbi:transcription factor grauzone [Stomoxys calcitrans]|uniref:C2H2-type domain-containing protein n=1 Tax=Stomoxys calcitrans TaxID=35570 RepID=A0A1I8PJG3_STOCA|nr:transcription factor grauzone [Stomoxys calcitrans]